jgi:hypothetical protein
VNLWPESVRALFGSSDALPPITPRWDKRYVALSQNGYVFGSNPLPLGVIYLLCGREDKTAAVIEEFSGGEAFMTLVANTHINYLIDRSMRKREFDALSRVLSSVPVRRVWPISDASAIRSLCQTIATDAMRLTANEERLTAVRSL